MARYTEYDGSRERRVLTAMITNTPALARIRPRWDREYFASPMAREVSRFCCQHFDAYGTAPGPAIEGMCSDWAEKQGSDNKETVRLVEKLLEQLAGEYERLGGEVNPDLAADQAAELFNINSLKASHRKAGELLDMGKVREALDAHASFSPVQMGPGSGTDLDDNFVDRVLDRDRLEPLVDFGKGPLGKFLKYAFCRHDFVSFFGKTGVGKSFWMLEVAWRAARTGSRVLYLEAGDMGEVDTGARILCRATKKPDRDGKVSIPTDVTRDYEEDGENYATVERRDQKLRAFTKEEAKQALKDLWGEGECPLRLHCFNARSTSSQGVEALIQEETRRGFNPDVVVLDYADILCPAPGEGKLDKRDQINERWLHLRSIPQKYHCLFVTATQADAKSYGRKLLGLDNFSDDRRKNDHVTAMIGINQDEREQEQGVVRLNFVKRRKGAFASRKVVYVAGCLALAAPAMRSCF